MPRARNIKHSFFINDELAEHNDPLGRLLFIGLWTIADFNGNIEWRKKKIKTLLLPYDECNLDSIVINLDKSGFIRIYSNANKLYINVPNFKQHQRPHINEIKKGTTIPEYDESSRQLIDFNTLTINPDLIPINPEPIGANCPDSCFLNPESINTTPQQIPENISDHQSDFKDLVPANFYPCKQLIDYAIAHQFPDITNPKMIEDFIDKNLSSNWRSANWQTEYKKFPKKWQEIKTREQTIKNTGGRNNGKESASELHARINSAAFEQ